MKLRLSALLAIIICVLFLAGCDTSISITYKVSTGDNIKVTLDTSEGVKLKDNGDGSFFISDKSDNHIVDGIFVLAGSINDYRIAVLNDPQADILVDTESELTWKYNEEYNRIIVLSDKTEVILASTSENNIVDQTLQKLNFNIEN